MISKELRVKIFRIMEKYEADGVMSAINYL